MIVSRYSDINIEDASLRPYQKKAKKEIFEAWDEVDNVMFQMPTGTGKTRLFTSIIRDINEYSIRIKEAVKILIVAHRTELIDQIDESLNKYCVPHNVIAGRRQRNYRYPVNVASIQTLSHPNNLADAKKLNVQFIIIDEAHHALASTYKKLWDMYPGSKKLGVTATPWRMNHQGFRDLFDTLIISMPVKDFISQGYLSSYKYYSLRADSDIQKTIDDIELDRFGEYRESSMEEKMDIGSIRAQLLNSYLSLAKGKKGIIYAINIEHAKHICSEYKAAGYITVCIDSKTPASERKELVEKFRKGQIDIIVNVDIFSEGFDCPDIEFIQLARPTRSLVKYLQQVGRGLRTTKNKQECVILDNVGMYARFGLPNARRHWKQHFLGKNVSEEPKSGVLAGTGRARHADLSEGTEDMELIQDIREERPRESVAVGFDDFFPLFGVTLGKTTWQQAENSGIKVVVWDKGPSKYMDVNDVAFWDFEGCGIFTSLYWTKNDFDFPDSWKLLGFSWENSYNTWLSAFRRLGFTVSVTKEPVTKYHDNRTTLNAAVEAFSKDGLLKFDLDFGYGEDGDNTSSPKSLYSLNIVYLGNITEKTTVDDSEEESFDPIGILEANNFQCDNFIFYFIQSKRIYETYIQDDTYFIVSELIVDEHKHCVHRKRVGKIPSNSWMYWQMLSEKIDELQTITHFGANYTVFHYRVSSSETNTKKDKYFDYKGREIDSPQTVIVKYEHDLKDGEVRDYVDVPVSKAYFNVKQEGPYYTIFRTVKGVSKPIAKMLRTSNFGFSHELDVALENDDRESNGLPQIRLQDTDQICVLRSDENSFTIKKTEKGKDYLLKYDLDGKLLDTTAIASVASTESNPLKADDIETIKHVFDKKTTSYKYFWFMSLLDIYKENQVENICFKQILVKMVSKAWKYVFMLNGKFSQSDKLPIYLINIQQETGLRRNSTELEVEKELNKQYDNLKIRSKLDALLKNVPYRFLSPWIPYTNNSEVMEKSWIQEVRCLYEVHNDHIVISKLWRIFLLDYYNCMELLCEYGLDSYLRVSYDDMVNNDFYNSPFPSLNKLLRGIKRAKKMYDCHVRQFLERYNFPLTGEITPADILKKMPETECNIDSEGRKRIHVPGELWSLKILDKLLSGEKMMDSYDNVLLLSDYGLETFQREQQRANDSNTFYKERFTSLSKLIKGIKKFSKEKTVKQFLIKHQFPLTGDIRPADVMKIIPESKCIVDSEGRKRVDLPSGLWTFNELDKMLSSI